MLVVVLLLAGCIYSIQAIDSATSQKVVRIDLQKHYIPHVEFEDLEESDEDDNHIQIEEIDENNFSMLREIQRQHISKSINKGSKLSKKDVQLVQTTSSMNEDLSVDSASEIDLDASISTQADTQSQAKSGLKQK